MEWHKFKDKMPLVGDNILLVTEDKYMALIEFTEENDHFIRLFLENEASDGNSLSPDIWYDTDRVSRAFCIETAVFWAYPSSVRLPK